MTHLLIWLLTYPLVASADTVIRLRVGRIDMNVGRHNAGHVSVYAFGTALLTVLHYV